MENLLDRAALAKLLGVSLKTLDKLRANGDFVRPIALGVLLRWRLADVQEWLDQKITDAEVK